MNNQENNNQINSNESMYQAVPGMNTENVEPVKVSANPQTTIGQQNMNTNKPLKDNSKLIKLAMIFSSFGILFWVGVGVMLFPKGNGNIPIGLLIILLGIGYMILCVKWIKEINHKSSLGYIESSDSGLAFLITFGIGILGFILFSLINVLFVLVFQADSDLVNGWFSIAKFSSSILFTWIPMIISIIISSSIKKKVLKGNY